MLKNPIFSSFCSLLRHERRISNHWVWKHFPFKRNFYFILFFWYATLRDDTGYIRVFEPEGEGESSNSLENNPFTTWEVPQVYFYFSFLVAVRLILVISHGIQGLKPWRIMLVQRSALNWKNLVEHLLQTCTNFQKMGEKIFCLKVSLQSHTPIFKVLSLLNHICCVHLIDLLNF